MTIEQALQWATKKLKAAHLASSALDAEILLAFVLRKPKEYLFTYPEKKLTRPQRQQAGLRGGRANFQLSTFNLLTNRRARHEPIAYLTGHKEFFGLDFLVNKNTLIPRPETEMLVEETLERIRNYESGIMNIIDVGTGSGAIAIAVAKKIPPTPFNTGGSKKISPLTKGGRGGIQFYATDYSPLALKLARQNARRNGVANQIKFLRGDLLSPILKSNQLPATSYPLLITANLPYLTTAEWKNLAPEMKKYEPRSALDGGQDGMKYLNTLFVQLSRIAQNKTEPAIAAPLSLRGVKCSEAERNDEAISDAKYPRPRLPRYAPAPLAMTTILLEIGYRQGNKIKLLARKYLPEYNVIIKKDLAGFDRLAILSSRRT